MRRIKRFTPLQLGKVCAILYGIMGLIAVPFILIMSLVGSQLRSQNQIGLAFGIVMAVAAPLLYAAMGFVIGVLGALIYNLVAKWIGGIEVEVE